MVYEHSKFPVMLYYALCVLLFSAHSFAQKEQIATYTTSLMGTNVTVKVKAHEDQREQVEHAIDWAVTRMEALVYFTSSWDSASETSRINDSVGGDPVDHCISVTVLAPDAETADAFSTVFFVMGPVKGFELCEKLHEIEALFIDNHFKISTSLGFPKITMMRNDPNVLHNNLNEFSGKKRL